MGCSMDFKLLYNCFELLQPTITEREKGERKKRRVMTSACLLSPLLPLMTSRPFSTGMKGDEKGGEEGA